MRFGFLTDALVIIRVWKKSEDGTSAPDNVHTAVNHSGVLPMVLKI